jgi:hypothetical protein
MRIAELKDFSHYTARFKPAKFRCDSVSIQHTIDKSQIKTEKTPIKTPSGGQRALGPLESRFDRRFPNVFHNRSGA